MNAPTLTPFRRSSLAVVVGLCLLPLALRAQTAPEAVVFTESGNSLTETLNGTPIGIWSPVTVAPGISGWRNSTTDGSFQGFGYLAWMSPDGPDLLNVVPIDINLSSQILRDVTLLQSEAEFMLPGGYTISANGATVDVSSDSLTIGNGAVETFVSSITFNDVVGSVPEQASSIGLGALAFLSLVVVRRYVTPHTAAV